MGNLINVNNSQYRKYEKEIEIMPSKHLVTVCDYLQMSLDFTFNFTDKRTYSTYRKGVDKKEAGKRLKEIRKELNLTQDKLAKMLNTTQSVIAGYESGRYLIATGFLYTICKKCGVSADYLLGKTDSPKYLK